MEDPSQQCFKVNIRVWNLDLTGSICGLLNLLGPLKKQPNKDSVFCCLVALFFFATTAKRFKGWQCRSVSLLPASQLKYLNDYQMDCHEVGFRHPRCPEIEL